MSLNMFWFLPTHGDGRYLGTEEVILTAIGPKQRLMRH